jgi:hypothetical protein
VEKFVESPNLPSDRVSLAVIDGRVPPDIENNLLHMGIRLIKTKKTSGLYEAISFHPDIVLHHLGGREILAAPNIDTQLAYDLENEGFKLFFGKKEVTGTYPGDISYNVARFGNIALCKVKSTDEILLEKLFDKGINIIDTNQGYAKCSVCVVAENAVITSDNGIYSELQKRNISTMLIIPGHIKLFNMDYGFIGGTSGSVSNSEIAFFGNLNLHPNYNEIQTFLSKYNKSVINLSKNLIADLGTLIPLKEYSILTP